MRNRGRGRRRLAITFVLALVGAALAPAAANADTVSFGTGSDFVDVFPNETGTFTVPVTLSYSDAQHLVAGSQVQLSPGPPDPGFSAVSVSVTVPSDWGIGKTVRVDAP